MTERGKPETWSQLQAMKCYLGKQNCITKFYSGESSAMTEEVPVMGMEEQAQALVLNKLLLQKSQIQCNSRVLV